MDTVQKLFRFLDESPTCYHAAANAKAALTAAGAVELRESEQWKLEKGTLYVVERGDSALVAFRVPEGPFHGFLMAAAHSDSPTFKVRETAEAASAGNTLRLSVEPYGGGVWRGWLDRPLSVAGRVVIRQGDRLVSRLVNIDRDLLVIPGVAIHMDRSVNKGAELNPAVDLLPLLGCGKEPGTFRKLIAEAAGVREEHLLSTELFLYPRTKAVQTGLNGEFIVSPRLDDLQCVFGCLEGFLAAKPGGSLPVLAVFNNEEVGSNTRQGADSTFLTDVLERIAHGCGLDSEAWKAAVANSFMVSADNAHAIHPAHPEYADKGEFPVLEKFRISPNEVMESVYNRPFPNRFLSTISYFLADYTSDDYVYDLITTNLRNFFIRNVCQYDYKNYPIRFVGSLAYSYAKILREVANEFDIELDIIEETPMNGLIDFHSLNIEEP